MGLIKATPECALCEVWGWAKLTWIRELQEWRCKNHLEARFKHKVSGEVVFRDLKGQQACGCVYSYKTLLTVSYCRRHLREAPLATTSPGATQTREVKTAPLKKRPGVYPVANTTQYP